MRSSLWLPGASKRFQTGGAGGDPYFASVELLLDGAGTDGLQDAVDHSNAARTITWDGAVVSNTRSLHGSTSIYFDGTNDFLSVADAAALALGNSDFTVEARVYFEKNSSDQCIYGSYDTGGNREFECMRRSVNSPRIQYSTNGTSTSGSGNGSSFSTSTDIELAWERYDDDIYIYKDGVLDAGPTAFSGTINDSGNPYFVGQRGPATGGADFAGMYLYELRVTVGVARYQGSGYTPTSELWPKS